MRDGQVLRTFLFGRIYRSLQWWKPTLHNPSELDINCNKKSWRLWTWQTEGVLAKYEYTQSQMMETALQISACV
jgi:hypothetical protein